MYKLRRGLADYFNFKGLCDKHCVGHVAKMQKMTISLCLSRKKVVNTILWNLYKKILKRVTYSWKFKETYICVKYDMLNLSERFMSYFILKKKKRE